MGEVKKKYKVLVFEFYGIQNKRVREQFNNLATMLVYGVEQITLTIERSEDKLGRYNMVVYAVPDKRLKAKDIAKIYEKLSEGIMVDEVEVSES